MAVKNQKGRGRPKGGRNEGTYPKIPIGIAFQLKEGDNVPVKIKVIRNKNIDEIMALNYVLPGIPEKAIIKRVVMGKRLIENIKQEYKVK